MVGRKRKNNWSFCIPVDLREINQLISDIPLIKGKPNIDLKMQAARMFQRTGLTAWTDAGRNFLAEHVLILKTVKINEGTVWFSDGDVYAVQAAMIKKRLRCVAGFGPEPHPYDEEGFNGWGYSPASLRYANEHARAIRYVNERERAIRYANEHARFSGQDDEG